MTRAHGICADRRGERRWERGEGGVEDGRDGGGRLAGSGQGFGGTLRVSGCDEELLETEKWVCDGPLTIALFRVSVRVRANHNPNPNPHLNTNRLAIRSTPKNIYLNTFIFNQFSNNIAKSQRIYAGGK